MHLVDKPLVGALFIGCLLGTPGAMAQRGSVPDPGTGLEPEHSIQDVQRWTDYMARTNRIPLVEGAGSRGAWGLSVGAGMSATEVESSNSLMHDELSHAGSAEAGDTQVLPKVWVLKGTNLPLNIGAVGGVSPGGRMTHAGILAQWTVYEGYRLPAVAARWSASRLHGFRSSRIDSHHISAHLSYGISYITGFVGAGLLRHQAQVNAAQQQRSWQETSYSFGAKAVFLPPFVSGGVEVLSGQGPRTIAAKVAIGM